MSQETVTTTSINVALDSCIRGFHRSFLSSLQSWEAGLGDEAIPLFPEHPVLDRGPRTRVKGALL